MKFAKTGSFLSVFLLVFSLGLSALTNLEAIASNTIELHSSRRVEPRSFVQSSFEPEVFRLCSEIENVEGFFSRLDFALRTPALEITDPQIAETLLVGIITQARVQNQTCKIIINNALDVLSAARARLPECQDLARQAITEDEFIAEQIKRRAADIGCP